MPFQFKYYKDPGVIIDAIKVLSLKLNSKYFWTSASHFARYNPQELDHLKKQLNSFETPPKELLLFFYKSTENSHNFMFRYVEKMLLHDFPQVTLSALYKKIEQLSALQQEIFAFYLPKSDMDDINLVSLLRTDNDLPDNIKFYLLSFQLDPQSFCSQLRTWIRKYAQLIEQTFLPTCQSFLPDSQTMQTLIDYAYPDRSGSFSTRPVLYSVCSVISELLYIHSSERHNWLITGYRFQEVVNALTQQKQNIDLQKIFEALGDSIRLRIINHLYMHKQSTKQEMIDALVIPTTSSHHHLEKLKKAGLIVAHRRNNNLIYSLNYPIFDEIADIFKTYSDGRNSLQK